LVQGGSEICVIDPDPFAIAIILEDPDLDQDRHPGPTDPDLDPYLFQPNVRQSYTLSKTFPYIVQNSENYDS
jgi:hypothetical protein